MVALSTYNDVRLGTLAKNLGVSVTGLLASDLKKYENEGKIGIKFLSHKIRFD